MKKTLLLLLVASVFSCQDRKTNEEALVLETTDVKQLMAGIDRMPVHEIEYHIEVDDKGNTIDTTSKRVIQYYPKRKLAYSHNTHYTHDDEYMSEQYFIPNGEFIYSKTSSRKSNYTTTITSDIDSSGLIIGMTIYYKNGELVDTMILNYDYTFNKRNERETLTISIGQDQMDVSNYIHYENNQIVRQYDIIENDTVSTTHSVYKDKVLREMVSEHFSNGHLKRKKESYHNEDGKIVSSSIYNVLDGKIVKRQEFTYTYGNDKRLQFIEENKPQEGIIKYHKVVYDIR